jgi:membrane-associated protease RseP (regulator of RpoE activity)
MFVLLSILVLGLLIVVHELGHFLVARGLGIRVSRFSIGFGPTLLRYRGPQVEYVLGALPLGGYVAFPEDDPENGIRKDDPDLLKNRPVRDRILVLLAGVTANFVLAYVLLLLMVLLGGVPEPQFKPGILVQQLASQTSAAAQAGIKAGDVIRSANGETLPAGEAAVEQLRSTLSANPGRPVTLAVERNGTPRRIVATPDREGKLGISLTPNGSVAKRPPRDIGEVFSTSAKSFQQVASGTFQGFGQLFSGKAGLDQLAGPVGIVAVSAEAARTDILNLFYVGALISFNLAVLNLLPLPALDGGQLVFVLIEALRGKPVPENLQRGITQAGLIVLLGLGLVLIFKDSLTLLGGG